jgi:hypothetical protein
MNIPTLIFGGLIATLYGAIFHFIRGGNLGRLITLILVSWAGFWTGHFIADSLDIGLVSLGTLNLGIATISSFIFLIVGYWIFFGRPQEKL